MSTELLVVASLIEALAVVAALVYARGQLTEIREGREESTRPFVVVDFEVDQTIMFLTIANMGQTIARNVSFEFTPTLNSTRDRDEEKNGVPGRIADLEMLNRIPSLAPGKKHTTIFDQVPPRLQGGLDLRYDVVVTYEGHNGKPYVDRQVLSFETFLGRTWVDYKGTHDIAKTLEEMSRMMRGWGAGLNGGLRIATDKDMAERNRLALEHYEERTKLMEEQAQERDEDVDASDEEQAA